MWIGNITARQCLFGVALLTSLAISSPVLADALDDVRAGNELFKAGRLDDAVAAYTKAVTSGELQSDTLAITYNNRGVAFGEQNDHARAIEDYKKALQLLPEDATTRKNLRVAYIKRGLDLQSSGEFGAASADLDAAIATEPGHYLGYLRRAELNVAVGNLALAVSDYKLALERNPGDSDLIAALNQAREALSRPVVSAETAPADAATTEETSAPAVAESPSSEAPAETSEAGEQIAQADEPPAQTPTTGTSDPNRLEPGAGGELMRTLGSVNVRDAPANDGQLVTTVGEGVVLPVLGEELGWKRVRLIDGREGYIYRRWMAPVDNSN